jgi:hypothetical protein
VSFSIRCKFLYLAPTEIGYDILVIELRTETLPYYPIMHENA